MIDKPKTELAKDPIMDGMVEIKGDNGAHYKAFVVDVIDQTLDQHLSDQSESKALAVMPKLVLRFENNWNPIEPFPINRIRLPPKPSLNDHNLVLKEDMEVEVMAAGQDNEEFGYWKAVIKIMKGDFYVVSYLCDESGPKMETQKQNFGEIVAKQRIRAVNTNPYLTSNPFFKFEIEIPKEVNREVLKSNEAHKHFKSALSLTQVSVDPMRDRLVAIGFADSNRDYVFRVTQNRALMLSEMHFRSLRAHFELEAEMKVLRQQLNHFGQVVKHNENTYELNVKIEEKFIGLAIGGNGVNLKKAMKIPGVVAIDNNDGVFRIIGTSRNSCLLAKEMLYFTESVINVPRDIVAHVIGKKGKCIQELIDKSGLMTVIIRGEDKSKPIEPFIPFVFIGIREAIDNANILLNFHLVCIKENMEIDNKLSPKSTRRPIRGK